MKLMLKVLGIALFDFIIIYGTGLILAAVLWRVLGWGMSPYLVLFGFGVGRILEMTAEKLEEARKQIATRMLMAAMRGAKVLDSDEDEDED